MVNTWLILLLTLTLVMRNASTQTDRLDVARTIICSCADLITVCIGKNYEISHVDVVSLSRRALKNEVQAKLRSPVYFIVCNVIKKLV